MRHFQNLGCIVTIRERSASIADSHGSLDKLMMKDRQVTDEAFKTEEMKKSHFFSSPSSTNQKKKQSAAEKVLRLKLEHQVPQLPLRAASVVFSNVNKFFISKANYESFAST